MKNLVLLFLQSILAFFSFSQDIRPYPMEENTLLWKVEGKGLKHEVYLFGTIHLIEKEQFYFPEKLKSIVENSEQIILEIGDLNPSEAMKYVMLSKGSFFDYFNEEQTDSILAWADSTLDMNEAKFRLTMNKMKPFVVVQLAAQLGNKKEMESYEMTIQSIAKEKNIKLLGFETIAEQMGFFDSMDSTQQNKMVMETIRDFSKSDSLEQKMYTTYTSQNVDKMYEIIATTEGMIQDMQTTLLDNRNANWIPQIKKMTKNKKTFIAVGAGHLGGPNGVIRLLEKEGYTLTPVKL